MKKKKALIIGIVLIIAVSLAIYYKLSNKNYIPKSNKMLAAKYYENYAWGYSFGGMAIFDDGTIYTWSNSENNDEKISKKNHYESLTSYIQKYADKSDVVVSEKDLKKLRDLITKIDDNSTKYERVNFMADYGEIFTCVYKDNQDYLIEEYGDWSGVSSDINALKIIEIIDYYDKQ